MKPFISTTFYGVMNYIWAFAIVLAPWFIAGTNGVPFYTVGGAAFLLPTIIGWLQLIMAIFSTNKAGFIRQFPMQMHNVLDVITGSFLLASPFVYGFSDKVWWPQVVLGAVLCFFGIFTKGSPFTTVQHHHMPEGQLTSTDSE